jgi:hypothetical protein
MIKLNLPDADLKIRRQGNNTEVFDPLRKKFVALTEEEWVRQHLIAYFIEHKKIPMHMMASERGLTINTMPRRFDLVVFSTDGKPAMIVECKAPGIPLNEDVFYQAARYNMALHVKYLLITNGLEHHCMYVDYLTPEIRFIEQIPDYKILNQTEINDKTSS